MMDRAVDSGSTSSFRSMCKAVFTKSKKNAQNFPPPHILSLRENLLGLTPLNSRLVHHTVTIVNVLL